MRTSTKLRRIAIYAETLKRERGDTEWETADRERIDLAYVLIQEAMEHPPLHRYTEDPDA